MVFDEECMKIKRLQTALLLKMQFKCECHIRYPSSFRRATFASVPKIYSPILLSDLITLWHGMAIGNWFLLHAVATARYAFGFPILQASSLYVTTLLI